MEFYNDNETWSCIPVSHIGQLNEVLDVKGQAENPPETVIQKLAEEVEKFWKLGDGCPKSVSSIRKQFENDVLPQYQKYRKGDMKKKEKE